MHKLISTIIFLSFLSVNMLALVSCGREKTDANSNGNEDREQTTDNTIIVPEYKDYNRGTLNFSDIEYSRPDITAISANFKKVSESIAQNEGDFEAQLNKIVALENDYSNLLTMRAYSTICFYRDNSNSYWADEYDYISTNFPSFSKAVEGLFVSAANSPHAEKFENEYFGESLIEDYRDGGVYSDEIVELMTREAELESEYSALSEAELETKSESLAVELFKIRRKISDLLGYSSYATFAYATYHDYSEDSFIGFARDISEYVVPVYLKLSAYIFNQFEISDEENISIENLINSTGKMLKAADGELYDIFSYMLQHSLYDVNSDKESRFNGAFTTYLDSYNAPFIFITTDGSACDFTTLCHEFGHFTDMYINYSEESSLDLSEVSSQALELLALTKFSEGITEKTISNLRIYEMENVLSTIVFQGFYAMFEHIAYQIPYEDICENTLDEAVRMAAEQIGLNSSYLNDLYYVTIPHIMLYPFYVQSYSTSAAVALEIYFTELDDEGAGFELYTTLLKRENKGLNFEEELERVGIKSPFEENFLKNLADRIHYELLGSHYFKNNQSNENAA